MTFATTLFRVAAPCLLAGAAHASPVAVPAAVSVAAADGGVPVPATTYQSALPYRPAAPEAVRPDQAWRAQNRIVGAYDSMALTGAAHAGHAAPADPHAGHHMPATPAAPAKTTDHADHADHAATPAPAAHQHGGQP
jgi:hypothetical protein